MATNSLFRVESLKGSENWPLWKFTVEALLAETEHALEVVTGVLTKPEATEATALRKWNAGNTAAKALMVKLIEPCILAMLISCKDAREMWLKLYNLYERKSDVAIEKVQQELLLFSWDPTATMTDFISRFEMLQHRMSQLGIAQADSMLTTKLLLTLPVEFEPLKQAWAARSKDSKSSADLVAVLLAESERRGMQSSQGTAEALVARNQSSRSSRDVDRKPAFGAGGFSKGNKGRPFNKGKSKFDSKSKGNCFGCGKPGHWKKDCRVKNIGRDNADAFISEANNAQVSENSWLADSGATDHLTNR